MVILILWYLMRIQFGLRFFMVTLILFYGNPNSQLRCHSWNLIRLLSTMTDLPWCLFGDFIEISSLTESTSSNHKRSSAIIDFKEVLTDCDLHDLGFSGPQFTYSNRRKGIAEVCVRLDRFFGNSKWCSLFGNAKVRQLLITFPSFYIFSRIISIKGSCLDLKTCG